MRILYLAPWVDIGGSDTATLDWCRFTPGDRCTKYLITTQISENRRLHEARPFVQECWDLPKHVAGEDMPQFLLDFVTTRKIDVVHVMNSQLGLELIPDFLRLSPRPRIVVQFHVEEATRDGYVGHYTKRFGNIVDLFMTSTVALKETLSADYGVPSDRVRLIRTGVRIPTSAPPEPGPDRGGTLGVLWIGRFVDQKDPLMAVKVARELMRLGTDVHLRMVGDGPLLDDAESLIVEYDLEEHVTLVGATLDLEPHYVWSDLLLMTSRFEGIPMVALDSLGHGRPVVGPDLATLRELLASGGGRLAEDSTPPVFANMIADYAQDRLMLQRDASVGRGLVETHYSLPLAGELTANAYEELGPYVERGSELRPLKRAADWSPLPTRSTIDEPLVSVVIACFNHASFLPSAVRSALEQDYENIEVIVVDDGSTDPNVKAVLQAFSDEPRVVVEHQENGGPSSARNRGIRRARGTFVFPLDADNELRPGAIRALVRELQESALDVAFVYPRIQYSDGRDDLFIPQEWSAYELVLGNYCDTGSLIDAAVFERGLWFREEPRDLHEDWDFFAQLAAAGYVGRRSQHVVINSRKTGFTRSDSIEAFHDPVPATVRSLGALGPSASLKARDKPALSLVDLEPDTQRELGPSDLVRLLDDQTSQDFEYLYISDATPNAMANDPRYHRVPVDLVKPDVLDIGPALLATKARHVAIIRTSSANPLIRTTLIEETLRLTANQSDACIIWRNPGCAEPLGIIGPRALLRDMVHPDLPPMRSLLEIAELCCAFDTEIPEISIDELPRDSGPLPTPLIASIEYEPADQRANGIGYRSSAILRATGERGTVDVRSWRPHATLLLSRVRSSDGTYRLVSDTEPADRSAQPLGYAPIHSPRGSIRLAYSQTTGRFSTISSREAVETAAMDIDIVCSLETSPFTLFTPVFRGLVPTPNGMQEVLIGGPDCDPLYALASDLEFLGFVHQTPIHPTAPQGHTKPGTGRCLVRKTDEIRRRHWYLEREGAAEEDFPPMTIIAGTPFPGSDALRIDEDGLVSNSRETRWVRKAGRAPRWIIAPMTWSDVPVGFAPRLRATMRRTASTAISPRRREASTPVRTLGWVSEAPHPGLKPLYSFFHPVTGDQLLTHSYQYGVDLGYDFERILGHSKPVRRSHSQRPIPWGSRFGILAKEVIDDAG